MNTIDWSYSKRRTLETCSMAYYFNYFGANKTTAKDEPNKDQLHYLKQIQNRYERAGDLLHITIATYFRHAKNGNTWIFDVNRLTQWARKMFRYDRDYSLNYPDGNEQAKKKYGGKPVLLHEFYYRETDAETLWREQEARLIDAIYIFATSDIFEEFRVGGCLEESLVEATINMNIYGIKVGGRIDLAYQATERFTVVDWKMGEGIMGGSNSLQLSVYALWAATQMNIPFEKIDVRMAHMDANTVTSYAISDEKMAGIRLRIIQDAELMTTLQYYGKKSMVSAFTPLLEEPVCDLCPFKKVCYA